MAGTLRAMRGRVSVRRLLLLFLGALALVVFVLNWTYGRLPAEPAPTGSFAHVGDLRIRYLEHRGAGVPVVLIHGQPGTAEDWEDVTSLLTGHRTIAIDRPGYGFSSGGYVPFDRQLEAIHELLEKLHVRRPILVGHSYGGTISLGFAERYPRQVRGLVLVDAAAGGQQVESLAEVQARGSISAASGHQTDRQRDLRPAPRDALGEQRRQRSVPSRAGRASTPRPCPGDQHDPR